MKENLGKCWKFLLLGKGEVLEPLCFREVVLRVVNASESPGRLVKTDCWASPGEVWARAENLHFSTAPRLGEEVYTTPLEQCWF